MKKRIKGLATLWLALILVFGIVTIPVFAAETTNAYYYEGEEALAEGLIETESDPYASGTPSTDAFQYGDGADTITNQVGSATEGQIGWKVWGAWISSGGFYVNGQYVTKSLESSLSAEDYEYLGYDTLVIERLYFTGKAVDITLIPDETLEAGIIYGATLSPAEGYTLPDNVLVFSGGNLLTDGTDYTYNNTNGEIKIKESAISGDITLIASGKIRYKEFRMGGENNATLQWRYEGEADTEWKDISTITQEGSSETTITLGVNGNLYVNGVDTEIKVNYAGDIANIIESTTNLQNSFDSKANASDIADIISNLNNAINNIEVNKTTIQNLTNTLNASVGTNTTNITNLTASIESLDAAYKSADEALGEVVKAIETKVEELEASIGSKADAEALAEAVAELAALQNSIETMQATLAGKADTTTIEALDVAYKAADEALGEAVKAIETKVEELEASIGSKADAEALADAVAELAALQNSIETMQATLAGKADTTTIEALDVAYKAADEALGEAVKAIETKVEELEAELQKIATGKADATELKSTVEALADAMSDIENIQKLLETNAGNIADITSKVETLEKAYATADKAIDDAVKALEAKVKELETELGNKAGVNELNTVVENLTQAMENITTIKEALELKNTDISGVSEKIDVLKITYTEAYGVLKAAIEAIEERIEKLEKDVTELIEENKKDDTTETVAVVASGAAVAGNGALLAWLMKLFGGDNKKKKISISLKREKKKKKKKGEDEQDEAEAEQEEK